MTETSGIGRIGGWEAPCAAFDYGKMAREAERECRNLKKRMDALKELGPLDAEEELVRRRELRMLTDIYYEQRHLMRLFLERT